MLLTGDASSHTKAAIQRHIVLGAPRGLKETDNLYARRVGTLQTTSNDTD